MRLSLCRPILGSRMAVTERAASARVRGCLFYTRVKPQGRSRRISRSSRGATQLCLTAGMHSGVLQATRSHDDVWLQIWDACSDAAEEAYMDQKHCQIALVT
ncbi:hypothetical protein M3J09_008934 [Ascochyta lentis]